MERQWLDAGGVHIVGCLETGRLAVLALTRTRTCLHAYVLPMFSLPVYFYIRFNVNKTCLKKWAQPRHTII